MQKRGPLPKTARIALLAIVCSTFFLAVNPYSQTSLDPNTITQLENRAHALKDKLIHIRRDIHMHPELGNREVRTARLVAEHLKSLGLDVKTGVAKTGVVGLLKGAKPGPTVAVRVDMDALPIQELNDVPYKSQNPGVKHACGHDVHTTVGLGTAEVLAGLRDKLSGTVKFIFQPAEEGPPTGEEGGARLMVQEGVLENPKVEAIFGIHDMPTIDVGTIGYNYGPTMASSDEFEIVITGKKVHAAYPHAGIDPIPIAAQVVSALQTVVSRQIDAREPAVLSVGIIEGGNRFNIIADKVRLVGTVRTLNAEVRKQIPERMERIVKGITESYGATYTFNYRDWAPVTYNDPELTKKAVSAIERLVGAKNVIVPRPQMGAEDFAYFAEKVPGFYFLLGVRNEKKGFVHMIHTEYFDVDEDAIPLGVKVMSGVVWDYLERRKQETH
jgi:amidohydrolase